MCNGKRRVSLGVTDRTFTEGQHICLIYTDDDDRRRTIARYLESGLRSREKVLYLVDTMPADQFVAGLAELGLDAGALGSDLVVEDALPVYCPTGVFSCPVMLDVVRAFYNGAIAEGYAGARGTGEMNWALVEGVAAYEDVMEYEATLTSVLQQYPCTACCQYDARRFDGRTIMDVLCVHPLMIVRGQVIENPFYVEPSVFLHELRARAQGRH